MGNVFLFGWLGVFLVAELLSRNYLWGFERYKQPTGVPYFVLNNMQISEDVHGPTLLLKINTKVRLVLSFSAALWSF